MIKTYFTVLATVLIAAFYLISFVPNNHQTKIDKRERGANGIGEDANGRYEYELMMLRDPATGKIPANIRQKELAFAKTLPTDADFSTFTSAGERTTSSSYSWQPRGPWNVGGRTRAMACDITNEAIIVAGSTSGGMYRSTDSGASWVSTTRPDQYQSVSGLAQDTRHGHTNVWYYCSGEPYGTSASATGAFYQGNGVFKSTDSGKTWTVLPASSTTYDSLTSFTVWGQVTWNIATNPADTVHDVVYVAAYGGIYKSLNGGTSWSLVIGTFYGYVSYFTDVAVSKSDVIYASLSSNNFHDNNPPNKGIYRSTDGITFTNITPAGFADTFNRVKIGISPMDENQVYFLCNTPGSGVTDTNYLGMVEWNSLWKYNYISDSGTGSGGLWRNLSANLPENLSTFNNYQCQGSYDMFMKPKPNDTNIVFIGGTNIYRSTSGFTDNTHTWYMGGYQYNANREMTNLSYPNHHSDQHDLYFLPSNPNIMICANDGGIFKTYDNTVDTLTWHSLDNGYLTTMFYTCAIDHAMTNNIIIGGAQDNGTWFTHSTNLTTPWSHSNGGDGTFCAIADSGKAYYMSIQEGIIKKLRIDSTGVVDSFSRIDPRGAKGYLFVPPFTLDPGNNNIMYLAAGKYLWRNDNLAGIPYMNNWDSIITNWVQFPDSVPTAGAVITAIAVSKTPANRVYFGTSSQKVYRINNANIGTPTPVDITPTSFPGGANVNCIAVDPNNADSLIVAFSNYGVYNLFFSANGGTTWSKIAGNLFGGNGPSLRWATIAHVSDGIIYLVSTSIGLFGTTHLNGISTVWTQLGSSTIGESVVNMTDYRTTDGLLIAATHSHGIFSTHLNSVSNVLGINNAITDRRNEFNFTNFPNPFNAVTTLRFDLSEQMPVSLTVYDELGRLVSTLANETMDAGQKKIVFSGQNLSPGIYYAALKAGTYSETRKMIMMR